jgi:hypothetical protein
MKTTRLIGIAAVMTAILAAPAVRAETIDDMRFGDIMTTKMMDKNKDGMVSRAEFLEMMGKVYDAKAKKMKVNAAGMTQAEINEILMYLRAGG